MTCIAAVEHRGVVWMGGDSAISWNESSWIATATPKVHRTGAYVLGWCGRLRLGNILQHVAKLPPPPKRGIERFLAGAFVDAMRAATKNEPKDDAGNVDLDYSLLVGTRGSIHMVDFDGGVVRCRDGFHAVGSGSAVAMGALYASKKSHPRQRILSALTAAEKYTTFVRAPFTLLSV